jgi:hypothetical protein
VVQVFLSLLQKRQLFTQVAVAVLLVVAVPRQQVVSEAVVLVVMHRAVLMVPLVLEAVAVVQALEAMAAAQAAQVLLSFAILQKENLQVTLHGLFQQVSAQLKYLLLVVALAVVGLAVEAVEAVVFSTVLTLE